VKLIHISELPESTEKELRVAGLLPVVFIKQDGTKVRGYLIDDEGLYWGVMQIPPAKTVGEVLFGK
jgi:hypothetical protein